MSEQARLKKDWGERVVPADSVGHGVTSPPGKTLN